MFDKKKIGQIKSVVGLLAGIGITMLCSTATKSLIGASGNKGVKRMLMILGGAVVAGMIGTAAQREIDEEVDNVVDLIGGFQKAKKDLEEKTAEVQEG